MGPGQALFVPPPTSYSWHGWARRLSWQQTAEAFHTSWHKVFSFGQGGGPYGLRQRSLRA